MEIAGLEPLIRRYLRDRPNPTVLPATLSRDLDVLYWKEVHRRAASAARTNAEQLSFEHEDRLLLDLGLLDWRFLDGGEKDRPSLLQEIDQPAPPHVLYLSEWLARRYRQFVLYGRLETAAAGTLTNKAEGDPRARLFDLLRPLFRDIPGFPSQAVDLFLSGRLDDTIDRLARQLQTHEDERVADQRRQLLEIRRRMISRARERAQTDEELGLFDLLAHLDDRLAGPRTPEKWESNPLDPDDRVEFVVRELKLVRSLIRLGVTGSGLTRTHSVLLASEKRLTKAEIEPVFSSIKESDPALPGDHSILIAPYVGTGFYEWDRDTIFVPLRPTRSAEEAIVAAVANYRISVDTLQNRGRLKRAYEQMFGPEAFRSSFTRDYKGWALGVAKGFKGALDQARFAFFRDQIGPSPDWLFAPREMVALTPEERFETIRQCRAKINRAEAGFAERQRLAIAYARDGRWVEALEQESAAAKLNPADGRTLFSIGWLAGRVGAKDRACRALNDVLELCPSSIWGVYASDELQRL